MKRLLPILLVCLWSWSVAADPLYQRQPLVEAHVDLFGGIANRDHSIGSNVFGTILGAAGRANIAWASGMNFQAESQFVTFDSNGAAFSEGAHFMHIYKRDPGRYAFGVFSGFSNVSAFSARPLGLEAQLYGANWTLYGQGSVWLLAGPGGAMHALQLRGQATYFLTPNTSLAADLAYVRYDSANFTNVLTLAATGSHRFAGTPFGVFAQARVDHFTGPVLTTGNTLSGIFGVRLLADAPGSTLLSHLRTGPAMTVLPLTIRGDLQ